MCVLRLPKVLSYETQIMNLNFRLPVGPRIKDKHGMYLRTDSSQNRKPIITELYDNIIQVT